MSTPISIARDEQDAHNPGWRYDDGPERSGSIEHLDANDLDRPAVLYLDEIRPRQYATVREALTALLADED